MVMLDEFMHLYLYLYLYSHMWDEYLQTCKLVQHPPALFFASFLQFINALCDYNAKDGDEEKRSLRKDHKKRGKQEGGKKKKGK